MVPAPEGRSSGGAAMTEIESERSRASSDDHYFQKQLQRFLEELCCDLCRFIEAKDGVSPADIRIGREVPLGDPGVFADIRVSVPGKAPYFVEVKTGISCERLVRDLTRKYAGGLERGDEPVRLVVVVDAHAGGDGERIEGELRKALPKGFRIELWDEERLLGLVREIFDLKLAGFSLDNAVALRRAVNKAKWRLAFGGKHLDSHMQGPLLWHFGYRRLRQLHEEKGLSPAEIMPPRHYPDVAVLLADLCSFSAFVRDTRDTEVMRLCLTRFCSAARYEILNAGGMLLEFVGDQAVGLFGIPDQGDGYLEGALSCARRLVDVGSSVAQDWQRRIDRVQSSQGVHVGIALGPLEGVQRQPFSRANVGFLGDCVNLGARLLAQAGPSEVVVSNAFYQRLSWESRSGLSELEPVEAKNMGLIKSWKLDLGS